MLCPCLLVELKFRAMTEQFVSYLPSAESSVCASVKSCVSVPKKLNAPGL